MLSRSLIGALILFVVVALIVMTRQTPLPRTIASLDIGVEHKTSMTLDVTITKNDRLRMIEFGNDQLEAIALSVPADWKRGEVRNVPLKDVTADAVSFGYVRWHLPSKTVVIYQTNQPFEQLNMHNPSGVPLKIRLTVVDLQKNTGEHEVYLVKDGSVMIL